MVSIVRSAHLRILAVAKVNWFNKLLYTVDTVDKRYMFHESPRNEHSVEFFLKQASFLQQTIVCCLEGAVLQTYLIRMPGRSFPNKRKSTWSKGFEVSFITLFVLFQVHIKRRFAFSYRFPCLQWVKETRK